MKNKIRNSIIAKYLVLMYVVSLINSAMLGYPFPKAIESSRVIDEKLKQVYRVG